MKSNFKKENHFSLAQTLFESFNGCLKTCMGIYSFNKLN